MRVLVAEDEVSTARALKLLLEKNKFTVDLAYTGTDAWDFICQMSYDVIVLDVMMPGMSGLGVLKNIRRRGMNTPVMLLTARGEITDRVEGLNAGADDYLPKPFAAAELIARVKALSRRNEQYVDPLLQRGNVTLDGNRYRLMAGGQELPLNNKEYQLMNLFMRHPGFVFSTEYLMEQIWGPDSSSNIDVVWTHMGFLRKKLKTLGADISIRTVRGAGYMLEVKEC